jgi:rubrerythrin
MTELVCGDIASVAEFIAHALELETESAERYAELADAMAVHNNPEVSALFRELAAESDVHAAKVRRWGADYELPTIAPWSFKWCCPEGPESLVLDDTHYLMTRREALQLALHNEIQGRDFYAQVAEGSANAEVRRLAQEMAAEEAGHVALLQDMLDSEPATEQQLVEDLDPPNMPE